MEDSSNPGSVVGGVAEPEARGEQVPMGRRTPTEEVRVVY